jgi:hypothetical protein
MLNSSSRGLSTSRIATIFAGEIESAGGSINNTFDDGRRLFIRAILPRVEEVRSGDGIKGGVALRADDMQAWVHPYTFRLVCQNGAIRSHAIQTHSVVLGEDDFSTELELREAIRVCTAPAVFMEGVDEMRSATERQADLMLDLISFIGRNGNDGLFSSAFASIMQHFFGSEDRSQFALMNAVTAVARETRDPEVRWRLEELGGGIPAARRPAPGPAPLRARPELALV